MKRKCLAKESCPIARSLDVIGDWWSLLIVRDAMAGKRRFGEFQKSLAIARNILTTRLRKLVADGILQIAAAQDGSAYQEYVLTPKGEALFLVIFALSQWAEDSLYENEELKRLKLVSVDRRDGQPVQRLELKAHDGRTLRPEDIGLISKETANAP